MVMISLVGNFEGFKIWKVTNFYFSVFLLFYFSELVGTCVIEHAHNEWNGGTPLKLLTMWYYLNTFWCIVHVHVHVFVHVNIQLTIQLANITTA